MYNVHMAHLTATEARRQFFRLLDAAQRGDRIEFERDGVRFRLTVAETVPATAPAVRIVAADAAVLSGEWTWIVGESGELVFAAPASEPE
jgi:hypothetical protein